MKKTLVIGSTALDIIIDVSELPKRTGDINIYKQTMSIGGCAFNVQNMLHLFNLPYTFCSPIGSGIYGDYVTKELHKLGLSPFVRIADQDSGCCYCFVEPDGERTFVSYHGVEYQFDETWLSSIHLEDYDKVYVCGLELEDQSGDKILDFLESHPWLSIFFAPGPRINKISQERWKRMMSLNPIIHLNHDEILEKTSCKTLEDATKKLSQDSNNTLIITDGPRGSYLFDSNQLTHIPTNSSLVINTIGAGDAHIGTILACRMMGYNYKDAIRLANQTSGLVVGKKGSLLTLDDLKEIDI